MFATLGFVELRGKHVDEHRKDTTSTIFLIPKRQTKYISTKLVSVVDFKFKEEISEICSLNLFSSEMESAIC